MIHILFKCPKVFRKKKKSYILINIILYLTTLPTKTRSMKNFHIIIQKNKNVIVILSI